MWQLTKIAGTSVMKYMVKITYVFIHFHFLI